MVLSIMKVIVARWPKKWQSLLRTTSLTKLLKRCWLKLISFRKAFFNFFVNNKSGHRIPMAAFLILKYSNKQHRF